MILLSLVKSIPKVYQVACLSKVINFAQCAPNITGRVAGSLVKSIINPFLTQGGICYVCDSIIDWVKLTNKLGWAIGVYSSNPISVIYIHLDVISCSFALHLAHICYVLNGWLNVGR